MGQRYCKMEDQKFGLDGRAAKLVLRGHLNLKSALELKLKLKAFFSKNV